MDISTSTLVYVNHTLNVRSVWGAIKDELQLRLHTYKRRRTDYVHTTLYNQTHSSVSYSVNKKQNARRRMSSDDENDRRRRTPCAFLPEEKLTGKTGMITRICLIKTDCSVDVGYVAILTASVLSSASTYVDLRSLNRVSDSRSYALTSTALHTYMNGELSRVYWDPTISTFSAPKNIDALGNAICLGARLFFPLRRERQYIIAHIWQQIAQIIKQTVIA
jgi:hypothetical protein